MSPLFWILASTWSFLGLAGGVAFCLWTIVDKPLQKEMDYKIRLHTIKEVSPTTLALCCCGIALIAIPAAMVFGPFGLMYSSSLLYNATNERISILSGLE